MLPIRFGDFPVRLEITCVIDGIHPRSVKSLGRKPNWRALQQGVGDAHAEVLLVQRIIGLLRRHGAESFLLSD